MSSTSTAVAAPEAADPVDHLSDAGSLLEQAAAMLDMIAAYLMQNTSAVGVSAHRSIYGVQSLVEKAADHVATAEDAVLKGGQA